MSWLKPYENLLARHKTLLLLYSLLTFAVTAPSAFVLGLHLGKHDAIATPCSKCDNYVVDDKDNGTYWCLNTTGTTIKPLLNLE